MRVFIYRDDGLGDALFTLPTLKIILQNLNQKDQIFFVSNYSKFIQKILNDQRIINYSVKDFCNDFIKDKNSNDIIFDIAIFLGPWGKIKNIKHFTQIIKTKAKFKFISSYQSKILFNFLINFLKHFLKENYFFINFEKIFEGHDILNTFNFINESFKISNFLSLDKYKEQVFIFYDYEKFFENAANNRKNKIILHFTYKSLKLGFSVKDYQNLINLINEYIEKNWEDGSLLVVFGPYEEKYFNLLDIKNKVIISELWDYVELCLESRGIIGFDTGPVHLAAFFNVPFVLSVFPDNGFDYRVKRWSPFSNKSKIYLFKYSSLKEKVIDFLYDIK